MSQPRYDPRNTGRVSATLCYESLWGMCGLNESVESPWRSLPIAHACTALRFRGSQGISQSLEDSQQCSYVITKSSLSRLVADDLLLCPPYVDVTHVAVANSGRNWSLSSCNLDSTRNSRSSDRTCDINHSVVHGFLKYRCFCKVSNEKENRPGQMKFTLQLSWIGNNWTCSKIERDERRARCIML